MNSYNHANDNSDEEMQEAVVAKISVMTAYLEQVFSKEIEAIQSTTERLPGVAPPIRRSAHDSYDGTLRG